MTRAISRKLLPVLSNHFWLTQTGSSYISVAVARKATGIGLRESAPRRLYLMKTTSGLVLLVAMYPFVKLLDTLNGNTAILPKTCVNYIVLVNNDDASGR